MEAEPMKYLDHSPMTSGDRVLLLNNEEAIVVRVAGETHVHDTWQEIVDDGHGGFVVETLNGAFVRFYNDDAHQVRKL